MRFGYEPRPLPMPQTCSRCGARVYATTQQMTFGRGDNGQERNTVTAPVCDDCNRTGGPAEPVEFLTK